MNQIVQMFKESNSRMAKLMKGLQSGQLKPDLEIISSAQREYEGQIKLVNAVISAFGIASKNKRAMTGLEKMNLMDETTAIDLCLGDPEVDKVKCPVKDHLITRAECLDYSGHHTFDDCNGCETGAETKEKLLNP